MLCLDYRQSGHRVPVSGLNKKRNPDVHRLIESLLEHLALFRFWTFLQHVGFFDTASDKTNQIGKARHESTHIKVVRCVDEVDELIKCERHCGVLFCVSVTPPVIRRKKSLFEIRHRCH